MLGPCVARKLASKGVIKVAEGSSPNPALSELARCVSEWFATLAPGRKAAKP